MIWRQIHIFSKHVCSDPIRMFCLLHDTLIYRLNVHRSLGESQLVLRHGIGLPYFPPSSGAGDGGSWAPVPTSQPCRWPLWPRKPSNPGCRATSRSSGSSRCFFFFMKNLGAGACMKYHWYALIYALNFEHCSIHTSSKNIATSVQSRTNTSLHNCFKACTERDMFLSI